MNKNINFIDNSYYRVNYGRKTEPLHVVFKIERSRLRSRSLRTPRSYALITEIIKTYSHKFFVKIDQISVQGEYPKGHKALEVPAFFARGKRLEGL